LNALAAITERPFHFSTHAYLHPLSHFQCCALPKLAVLCYELEHLHDLGSASPKSQFDTVLLERVHSWLCGVLSFFLHPVVGTDSLPREWRSATALGTLRHDGDGFGCQGKLVIGYCRISLLRLTNFPRSSSSYRHHRHTTAPPCSHPPLPPHLSSRCLHLLSPSHGTLHEQP
jgi:hypothetical protein